MFAIIQTGGSKIGKVRSLHRSFNAAMKAQPATYHGLVNIADRKVVKGEISTILIDLLNLQTIARREGRTVTGHELPYLRRR